MSQPELSIREFQPFASDTEAAEVHGKKIERIKRILGRYRPNLLSESEIRRGVTVLRQSTLIVRSLGPWSMQTLTPMDLEDVFDRVDHKLRPVAYEVGTIDSSIDLVVFSRTGALALRKQGVGDILEDSSDLIEALDSGSYHFPLNAQPLEVN